MSKSVAPPSLTLLKRNSGTRSNKAVSALNSIQKYHRLLADLLKLLSFTKQCIEMCGGL